MRKLILLCAISVFCGCSSGDNEDTVEESANLNISESILEQVTPLNDILLPSGTKIIEISESEIEIELPKEYSFLTLNDEDQAELTRFGGYSCTCSASNSCKVIYNESAGYGCLQNSCSESCTGTPSTGISLRKPIYGVLNTSSKEILANEFVLSGNMNSKGYELFFSTIAVDKINEFYDFVYHPLGYKNYEDFISKNSEKEIEYVLLQYMGISFSAAVPNFDENKAFQNFEITSGPTVNCSGSNGCSCTKDKTCFLGNCIFTCEGCTTCTLEVVKK